MRYSEKLGFCVVILVLSYCGGQKLPDTSEQNKDKGYVITRQETLMFSAPVASRGNQTGTIPKGAKLPKIQRLFAKFNQRSVDWTKVKYKDKGVWILTESVLNMQPLEDESEVVDEPVFRAPKEFHFDRKQIMKIAHREILKLEKSEPRSVPNDKNDYLNLEKPTIASVINIDENKEKHFAIIVFFDALSGEPYSQYVIIKKYGQSYRAFGRGASVQSKQEKINEIRGDKGYFMPVD